MSRVAQCAGQAYSYARLDEMTNRYANGLATLGVGRGTHVAVTLPNCPESFWTIWGLAKLGAVGVPLNTSAERRQPIFGAAGTRTGARAS
jgi:crotonobetaine/carnitine-CoA ligase